MPHPAHPPAQGIPGIRQAHTRCTSRRVHPLAIACPAACRSVMLPAMRIIIISGLSGSGKTIALNLFEDAAYYCVDNLPAILLPTLIDQLIRQDVDKAAVAIDSRSGESIAALPQQPGALREAGHEVHFLFLDAKDETLLKRYSETRRRHPLASDSHTLSESIAEERRRLAGLAELGHRIDTSGLAPNALREWIRQFVTPNERQTLTLLFESFGFKHGVPLDAELVFDVRCLPNPHYNPALRPLTGRDAPVADFLDGEAEVRHMREDIARFIKTWLPCYIRDNRNYLTVGIGCTGGRHRSVYLAEWLACHFQTQAQAHKPTQMRVLVRHRELPAAPLPPQDSANLPAEARHA